MNPQKLIHIGGYVKFFYLGDTQTGKVQFIGEKTLNVEVKIAGTVRTVKVFISACEVVS